jgi:ATP-dependent 26S proteasome regulatory subunit
MQKSGFVDTLAGPELHLVKSELNCTYLLSFNHIILGSSEKLVHNAFEKALKNPPCLIFLDELDVLTKPRSSNDEKNLETGLLQMLLLNLHTIAKRTNVNVLVVAATNRPNGNFHCGSH